MKINKSKIKWVFLLIVISFNIIAIAGCAALLINPAHYFLWNFFGYIVLLALFCNIISAYLSEKYRFFGYLYLSLHIVSMLLLPVMNTFAASGVHNKTSQNIFVFILYILIFLFGAAAAFFQVKNDFIKRNLAFYKKVKENKKSDKIKNIMRWTAVILFSVNFGFGIYAAYIMMGQTRGNMIEVFISEYAVFWGYSMLGISLLIKKLLLKYKKFIFDKIILSAGILIFVIFLIPLFSVPVIIKNADTAFREAFGNEYLNNFNNKQNGFMKNPFSLQDYLFGKHTLNYIVKEDVLYYEEPNGLKLRFDAYMPVSDNFSLKNLNPVLIRIHGGAWTMGDKGFSNYSAANKHFANLGYVVFDIQYGINNQNPSFAGAAVPAAVKGNFDIDDMVRHIGIFTAFLADNADTYGADTDSVFISGASAGGQLAIAAALGITSGRYTDILDSRLKIKGLIPFYPANGLSPNVGIGGAPDLVDPGLLAGTKSPPCLIYHGTHDGIVPPRIATNFKEIYSEKSYAPCALIWMNFSGHGSDIYTAGYYNQIFMYYMERFMHQYR